MKIKVCGMGDLSQIKQLDSLQVDYAGMIFYNQSERFVPGKLKGEDEKKLHLDLKKVGVFVNESEDNIFRDAELFGLDLVQLHGDETPAFCKGISERLTVIKAFRIHKDNEQNIDWMIKPYEEHCDFYLFDTNRKGAYGGTGKKFDWSLLQNNKINKPFFLSGGIGPGDVEKIRKFDHPFIHAIDVNSRFEITPGVKDMEKIKLFVNQIKNK